MKSRTRHSTEILIRRREKKKNVSSSSINDKTKTNNNNSKFFLCLGFNESQQAFVKHFDELFQRNKDNELVLISLVDEWGKECLLNDSFYEHIIKYNQSKLTYISFDFHEYWFEDISFFFR